MAILTSRLQTGSAAFKLNAQAYQQLVKPIEEARQQANAGGWRAELAAALPSEAHVSSLERDELEAWWMGDAPLAQQPSGPSGAAKWATTPDRYVSK